MKTYKVEVSAHLNNVYTVAVDAEDEDEARAKAADEVYGVIEPFQIDVTVVDLIAL